MAPSKIVIFPFGRTDCEIFISHLFTLGGDFARFWYSPIAERGRNKFLDFFKRSGLARSSELNQAIVAFSNSDNPDKIPDLRKQLTDAATSLAQALWTIHADTEFDPFLYKNLAMTGVLIDHDPVAPAASVWVDKQAFAYLVVNDRLADKNILLVKAEKALQLNSRRTILSSPQSQRSSSLRAQAKKPSSFPPRGL